MYVILVPTLLNCSSRERIFFDKIFLSTEQFSILSFSLNILQAQWLLTLIFVSQVLQGSQVVPECHKPLQSTSPIVALQRSAFVLPWWSLNTPFLPLEHASYFTCNFSSLIPRQTVLLSLKSSRWRKLSKVINSSGTFSMDSVTFLFNAKTLQLKSLLTIKVFSGTFVLALLNWKCSIKFHWFLRTLLWDITVKTSE